MRRILIYGYGNPGRQDDGLGPALAERFNNLKIPGVETDSNYQLNIEDAVSISQNDIVIFVDAKLNGEEHFTFSELVSSSEELKFTTHSATPEYMIALTNVLFKKKVKAFILAIRGYSWDFMREFTTEAENNLEEAYRFLKEKLVDILKQC